MRATIAREQRGGVAARGRGGAAAARRCARAASPAGRRRRPATTNGSSPASSASSRSSRAQRPWTVVHRAAPRSAPSIALLEQRAQRVGGRGRGASARIAAPGASAVGDEPGEALDERRSSCRCPAPPTTSSGPPGCVDRALRGAGGVRACGRGHRPLGYGGTWPAEHRARRPTGSGACRRAVAGCAACSPSTRRARERVVETGDARRGRRPHARDRPARPRTSSSRELDALHAGGRALHRRLRGARRGRLRRRRASAS